MTVGVNGTRVALRRVVCKFLEVDKQDAAKTRCSVYRNRFHKAPWCMSVGSCLDEHRLPNDCPYVKDDPEYTSQGNVDYVSPVLEPLIFEQHAKTLDIRRLLTISKPWPGPNGE